MMSGRSLRKISSVTICAEAWEGVSCERRGRCGAAGGLQLLNHPPAVGDILSTRYEDRRRRIRVREVFFSRCDRQTRAAVCARRSFLLVPGR